MNKLTNQDYCRAAKSLNCEVAAIKAVASVESAGDGFLPSGKVKILFERHHFSRLTNRVYDAEHPQISNRIAGGYYGNEKEYLRFNQAFKLNPKAALMSCSWGKFQIMGFNYAVCGFATVGAFVDAMKLGEGGQLQAFCGFVETNNLDDELRRRDWKGFARGYNGKSYEINNYDGKMLAAYNKFKLEKIDCSDLLELEIPVSAEAQLSSSSTIKEQEGNLLNTSNTLSPINLPGASETSGESEHLEAEKNQGDLQVPAPEPVPVIAVPQVSAETEQKKEVTGIQASLAGAVTFITTSCMGILTWLGGVAWQIVAVLAAAAIIVGIIYLVNRFWFANREKEREHDERMRREQQAFELQKLTLESAMRRDLNTVVIKPTPMRNSDAEEVK